MKTLVGVLAVLGLAVAAPSREKRQTGCVSAFQNVPNVCSHNPAGQVFFAHPTDSTKFLQCDVYSRMYIIQCPSGEIFDLSSNSCQPSQQPPATLAPVTVAPATVAPVTVARVTQPPFTMPPMTARPVTPAISNNPCTPQSMALGQLYFPYPGDKTKFIECDLQGHPSTLDCPHLLVWDQTILSCVYLMPSIQTPGQVKPTPQIPAGQSNNPCTSQAISSGRLFFPHPDRTKYIQCDLWGDAFVNSCPSKLIWNAALETCFIPYPTGRK